MLFPGTSGGRYRSLMKTLELRLDYYKHTDENDIDDKEDEEERDAENREEEEDETG